MAITLRTDQQVELTYEEADENFSSLFYSASIVGSTISLYYTGSQFAPDTNPVVLAIPVIQGTRWTASLDGSISRNSSIAVTGSVAVTGTVTGSAFRKIGGTSAQVLLADGSIATAGANVTISGGTISATNTTYTQGTGISIVGTTINNTSPDQTVSLTQGGATTITGTYPNFTISSTDTDTNTTYTAGNGLVLTGTTFKLDNLQRVATTSFTLSDSDNNYTIFINNNSTAVNITVPSGLLSNFNVGFIQEGTGLVTFVQGSGTTLNTATGLKIKGQKYQAFLEKKGSTETFYLLGNVIA